MSTTIRLLSAAAVLLSSAGIAAATIISPANNASWNLNSQHQVEWDTAGLQAPLQMHLCPGGAIDLSSSIVELAPSIQNSGSWTWHPQASIPKHESYTIIIVDVSGHQQISDMFHMIGWPQQPYQPANQHTTIVHPPVYTPPAHLPPVHTTIIHQPPVHTPSIHIAPVLVTSQPAPIVKTIEAPPVIKTEEVAPIIRTEIPEPVTKVISQAPIWTTEYLAPIVKTILVTETPPPVIKNISQPPLTVVETLAPVFVTESQPPIVTTIQQAPYVVTEHPAPVVITEHITQTIHPSVVPVHTPVVIHTPVVYTSAPAHTLVSVHTSAPVHTSVVLHSTGPIFTNATSASIPPTEIAVADSTTLSTTSTAVALPASGFSTSFSMGAAASTGLGGGPQGTFTGGAGRTNAVSGSICTGLMALIAFMI